MVYGPKDPYQLDYTLRHYAQDENNSRSELLFAHAFALDMGTDVMIKQISETIQLIEGTQGREFTDAFMVMREEDATPPWAVGFGCGNWALTYAPETECKLFAIYRHYLYDWYAVGGRWKDLMRIKPDSVELTTDLGYATIGGWWHTAPIGAVDWEAMAEDFKDDAAAIVRWRSELLAKGVIVPTLAEFFLILHPDLYERVSSDQLNAYQYARRWDTHHKFNNRIAELTALTDSPTQYRYSHLHRWSSAMLERLEVHAARVLTGFIVNDTLYDLEDSCLTEELLNKGLDQLEALTEDTIVAVVDIHF